MIFNLTPLAALVFATLASAQQAPIVYDAIHNATTIVGSWSTGSKAVKTGTEFANPSNKSFTYPKVTGEAYAFTDDGWYEISRYRMVANGAEPNCITALMFWTHGKYTLEPNGTITTIPNGDGYQQVQDPCAPVSNLIEPFNQPEPFTQWRIFSDSSQGYKLHLWRYDGTPVAPLFQVSTQPIMLPKEQLRNDPAAPAGTGSTRRKRSLLSVVKRSNAATGDSATTRWTVMSVGASVLFALGSSMI